MQPSKTGLILYHPSRVTAKNDVDPEASHFTYQEVLPNGEFDNCVSVSEDAYKELLQYYGKDKTTNDLKTYLKETWKRLMEQHRIFNATACEELKEVLDSAKISETFAAFNTGLRDKENDIYAVLIHKPEATLYSLIPYGITLQHSGMYVTIKSPYAPKQLKTPFINFLRNKLEDLRSKFPNIKKEFQIYHNKKLQNGLKISIDEALQKKSSRNSITNSLCLYEPARVSPILDGVYSEYTDTYQVVHKDGDFERCVQVTDDAYVLLKRVAASEQIQSRKLLHNYLNRTWKRLMEQHRIVNAKLRNVKEVCDKDSIITEIFAVFNTGLVTEEGDDIYAVLVADKEGSRPYKLLAKGITRQHCDLRTKDKTPFIRYLKEAINTDKIVPYKNMNLKDASKVVANEAFQKPSYKKWYCTSPELYVPKRVFPLTSSQKFDDLPHTEQIVFKDGGLDECVYVTDHAYAELKRLATNERTCDKWTKESLHSYLKYTWIRLMEQHRILNAIPTDTTHKKVAPTGKGKFLDCLASAGISSAFVAFNTGLVNEDGDDIYAVLVQSLVKENRTCAPYTLLQSGITLQHRGIFITIENDKKPFINYLKKSLIDEKSELKKYFSIEQPKNSKNNILERASFFFHEMKNYYLIGQLKLLTMLHTLFNSA